MSERYVYVVIKDGTGEAGDEGYVESAWTRQADAQRRADEIRPGWAWVSVQKVELK